MFVFVCDVNVIVLVISTTKSSLSSAATIDRSVILFLSFALQRHNISERSSNRKALMLDTQSTLVYMSMLSLVVIYVLLVDCSDSVYRVNILQL